MVFGVIEQIKSGDRNIRNDIMAACWKYCAYLKDLEVESLTPEESEFMKTMEELDALYEAEMNRVKLQEKMAIALNMLQENIPLDAIARITELSIEQIQQLRSPSDLGELTAEEIAQRVAAIERFAERKRQIWESSTPEEKIEHDRQFEHLHRYLAESRK
jgi:hypothetical protein